MRGAIIGKHRLVDFRYTNFDEENDYFNTDFCKVKRDKKDDFVGFTR